MPNEFFLSEYINLVKEKSVAKIDLDRRNFRGGFLQKTIFGRDYVRLALMERGYEDIGDFSDPIMRKKDA